jgi:hypothetical protein
VRFFCRLNQSAHTHFYDLSANASFIPNPTKIVPGSHRLNIEALQMIFIFLDVFEAINT